MSDGVITLYDIPSAFVNKAWSPNVWKTRFALNYKGLAYKTTWVEYPDIASMCKNIGAAPTAQWKDGTDYYSVPVISDPKTGRIISDSYNIAKYLDEVYPELPTLFPPGTHALQAVFKHCFSKLFSSEPAALTIPPTCAKLNPPSAEYYRRKHESSFGCKLEEIAPEGPKRDEVWEGVKKDLDALALLLDESGDGPFVMGDTISYADFLFTAWFKWGRVVLKAEEWEMLMGWNGGRWARLMKECEKYETVI